MTLDVNAQPKPKKKRGPPFRSPEGRCIKQNFTLTPESYDQLTRLASVYGSKANAMRLALAALEALGEAGAATLDSEDGQDLDVDGEP